jgi:hypothetical protein
MEIDPSSDAGFPARRAGVGRLARRETEPRSRRRCHAARASRWLVLVSLASACSLVTLKKDIERAGRLASLEGQAAVRGANGGPIVVVVYSIPAARVVDLFVLPSPGPFFFALPAGKYQLAAFEDRNRDLVYQPAEESAVLFSAPTDLELRPGERRAGLGLVVDPNGGGRLPFAVSAASERRQIDQLPTPQLGTIVTLDDPRFSEENAKLGLWDPLRFLTEVGAGVYFLEEYDPKKTPVLFVHGALGHPGNWKELVAALDRGRFQPWLVYYPTAPHLERVAEQMLRTLAALEAKYRFPRLILVAHSMGGLVTRAGINFAVRNAGTGRIVQLPVFVSISSPWNGHSAAAKGVEYSPVVAPSWEDMAPGSPFLTTLPQTALPAECEYSLFFSYRGSAAFGGEANDGTVTVSSELSLPIQRQAVHVMGFDETHTNILRSPEVAAQLNAILEWVNE